MKGQKKGSGGVQVEGNGGEKADGVYEVQKRVPKKKRKPAHDRCGEKRDDKSWGLQSTKKYWVGRIQSASAATPPGLTTAKGKKKRKGSKTREDRKGLLQIDLTRQKKEALRK